MEKLLTKTNLRIIQISTVSLLPFVYVAQVFAQNDNQIGFNPATSANPSLIKETSPSSLITFIVGAAVVIAVFAALLFIIIGGLQWVTSSGDKAKVESARNHIIAAVIGLIIVVLSVALLNFVTTLLGLGSLIGGQSLNIPVLGNN